MEGLLLTLAVLACPVGMGLMMFFMMRGQHRGSTGAKAATPRADEELAALRSEVERLKADRAQRQPHRGDR